MARRHFQEQEDDAEINVTPMLDIVFIMLIFFIVTTSFIKETGIDPDRPQAVTAREATRGNILVAVAENGDVWMENNRVEMTTVRQLVEDAKSESPESSVVVIADEKAPTGKLIEVMDQVRLAGITNIDVAAESSSR